VSKQPPQFAIGDTVCERFPDGSRDPETGTVINRYEFGSQYRYVVRFKDNREEVFFERDLLTVPLA